MEPTIGGIVHYKLSSLDVAWIKRNRTVTHDAAPEEAAPEVGDVLPAIIVHLDPVDEATGKVEHVNLMVFLDGFETYWARDVAEDDGHAAWKWPP